MVDAYELKAADLGFGKLSGSSRGGVKAFRELGE